MFNSEFAPEDVSEMTVESLLDSLSLGIMRDNIIHQIKGSIDSQQNFLSIVIEKFENIIQNVVDDDISRELKIEISDFCKGLIVEIANQYNLIFDDHYETSMEYVEMLSVLYNFFILRKKEYVTNFLIEYIRENRQHLMDSFGTDGDDKPLTDITTVSNKKKNIQKDNIWILSNVNAIINFITSVDIGFSEFLNTINDGDFYISKLIDYVDESRVGGDVVSRYIGDMTNDYSSPHSTEIRNSVRLAFMTSV